MLLIFTRLSSFRASVVEVHEKRLSCRMRVSGSRERVLVFLIHISTGVATGSDGSVGSTVQELGWVRIEGGCRSRVL